MGGYSITSWWDFKVLDHRQQLTTNRILVEYLLMIFYIKKIVTVGSIIDLQSFKKLIRFFYFSFLETFWDNSIILNNILKCYFISVIIEIIISHLNLLLRYKLYLKCLDNKPQIQILAKLFSTKLLRYSKTLKGISLFSTLKWQNLYPKVTMLQNELQM